MPRRADAAPLSTVATSVLPLSTNASRVTSRVEPSPYVATTRNCWASPSRCAIGLAGPIAIDFTLADAGSSFAPSAIQLRSVS
jgi:hypothetical protein